MTEAAGRLADALESGEFDQGPGQLRSSDKFCCLGVACEIYRRETGEGEWEKLGYRESFMGETLVLPVKVQEYFGFKSDDGDFFNKVEGTSLAGQNDRGETFQAIAHIIRTEPTLYE